MAGTVKCCNLGWLQYLEALQAALPTSVLPVPISMPLATLTRIFPSRGRSLKPMSGLPQSLGGHCGNNHLRPGNQITQIGGNLQRLGKMDTLEIAAVFTFSVKQLRQIRAGVPKDVPDAHSLQEAPPGWFPSFRLLIQQYSSACQCLMNAFRTSRGFPYRKAAF